MQQFEQVIIGAGFSGICMGIQLRKAGFEDFVMLERDAQAGGTWFANSYPGAACDIQSHLYSFSFEPNPNWSRMFSPQPEIWAYMQHCVAKYDLQKHLRCNTTVNGARYLEESAQWEVTTASGEQFRCKQLIACMGGLSQPALPQIQGLQDFKGVMFHSAQWNHEVNLADKTVAIIGTGASAIQIVPAIANKVKQLLLFQRTPPWIMPKPDRPVSNFEKKMFALLPFTQKLMRLKLYLQNEMFAGAFVSHPAVLKYGQRLSLSYLQRKVKDEKLREALTPNYTMGCKRILFTNNYYPALQRENVSLISKAVSKLLPHAIQTADGSVHAADVIVFATGFQASEDILKFDVVGKNNRSLVAEWKNGPEAYRGTTVSGFPNLFFVIGPNTGLGHNSLILMIEAQVNYIIGALKKMKRNHWKTLEVKAEKQQHYNIRIQADLAKSVWQTGGCKSWYQNSQGKNIAIWPGYTFSFMRMMNGFDAEAYTGS